MFLKFDRYLINMSAVLWFREESGSIRIRFTNGHDIDIQGNLKDLMKMNVSDILTQKENSNWFLP